MSIPPSRASCSFLHASGPKVPWLLRTSCHNASPAVQETAAWHLEGAVDTDALQHALAAVAQRHELLRSRFWRKNGKLVQSVDGEAPKLELKPLSKSYGAVQGVLQVVKSLPIMGGSSLQCGVR